MSAPRRVLFLAMSSGAGPSSAGAEPDEEEDEEEEEVPDISLMGNFTYETAKDKYRQGTMLSKLFDVKTMAIKAKGGDWYGQFKNSRRVLGAEATEKEVEERNVWLEARAKEDIAELKEKLNGEITKKQLELEVLIRKLDDVDPFNKSQTQEAELLRAARRRFDRRPPGSPLRGGARAGSTTTSYRYPARP